MIEYTVEVCNNGTKYWYLNKLIHREDGPAIEYSDGIKEWYLNGKEVTEAEHKFMTQPTIVKKMTVAEIAQQLGYDVEIVKGD